MAQISLRLPDELLESLDEEAEERNVSRSQYIRDTLESRHGLRREIAECDREIERLNRERRQLLEQREENQQLRRYVENDVEWHEASLPTRLRWWLFGKD